jgi:pimeloyl-ACP methyl ester carboxylesterase
VLDDLDARGITRAVLVGHSYGGGVALVAAALAPRRVEAVILLASVGSGCVNGWDKLLAAPGTGQLCALVAWRVATPGLTAITGSQTATGTAPAAPSGNPYGY